jgi:hypothetical protein
MQIGFTGTRRGMTPEQKRALRELLSAYHEVVLHHGDCIGADAEAHDIAIAIGWAVVIHPPIKDTQRAWKSAPEVRAPKPYLSRNKDIVRETEILIAAPAEVMEHHRSGTWSTVRYAIRVESSVRVIRPDGGVGLP